MEEQEARKALIRKSEIFKRVFSSEDGQQVLEWLAEYCGQNIPSYAFQDANTTIWNDGKRAVYLQIKTWIDLELPKDEGNQPSAEKRGAVGPTLRRKKDARE